MAGDPAFGTRIKQLRKALDLTQEMLAEQVACSVDMIRKVEAGRARPSRDLAELLAVRLEIPPEERQTFVQWARTGSTTPASAPVAQVADATQQGASRASNTNLPVQLTSFVDREREVAEVRGSFTPHLLTLIGTGGIGKTRLALE